jgi:hypothetical protein
MGAGGMIDDLIPMIDRMNDLRREYSREREPFTIYATAAESFTADGIKRLEDLGVTHTAGGFGRFNPYGLETDPESLQEKIDNLDRYADEVIAAVR